jgi:hypothetical protein
MNSWQLIPRAVRRKSLAIALRDPRGAPYVRKQLEALKVERDKTARLLQAMNEAIEDTEALLGELNA